MKHLHPWNVDIKKAIQIQSQLREKLLLKKDFKKVEKIGGADVSYSKGGELLYGAIVVFSYPEMDPIDSATAEGRISFPYIPGLLSFREGPILIQVFEKLRVKPDLMIFDGHGIAHPRTVGLASHLGLCLELPSIGCGKTPLIKNFQTPGPSKGSFEWIYLGQKKVGVALRTKEKVKPVFVSPGHRIDLKSSVQIILEACRGYRIPEPLRRAHILSKGKMI
ncbi:MAG: deoxyribonuclease V [Thermodesulfobacteriota bacterium]